MANEKLTRREVITAKIESTYNVDPTPVTGDSVLVQEPSWSHEGASMIEDSGVGSTLAKRQQIFGGTLKQVSFDVMLRGSGAAGTAPEVSALLRACGMGEAVSASTSVIYTPVSTGIESCTIYYYQDGILNILTGCRGNVSFSLEARGAIIASFTMTGHETAPTDTAIITPTYDAVVAEALVSIPFAIGAYSAIINSISTDLGNEVVTPPDISSSDGFGEIRIAGRDVTGQFDPEVVALATKNFIADWKAGASAAMTTGAIGGTAGNIIQFDWASVYMREVSMGDRESLRAYELGFGAAESSGDDEITITFT